MRLAALLVALVVFAVPAVAGDIVFPDLTGRVVDDAGVLDANTERRLDLILAADERANGSQVVVVTLPSLQGRTIEDFGVRLGRHWGIGTDARNDGVMLIVAPAERAVRIEVGYGLEGILTDARARLIIEDRILPRFRIGDMEGGIVAGAVAIVDALAGRGPAETPSGDGALAFWLSLAFVVFLLVVVSGTVFLFDKRGSRSGDGSRPDTDPFGLRDFDENQAWERHRRARYDGLDGGGGFGGGGSSGGGGFHGGGGSFGGGGATGHW